MSYGIMDMYKVKHRFFCKETQTNVSVVQKNVMYAGSCKFTLFCVVGKGARIRTVSLCQGVNVDGMFAFTLRKKVWF